MVKLQVYVQNNVLYGSVCVWVHVVACRHGAAVHGLRSVADVLQQHADAVDVEQGGLVRLVVQMEIIVHEVHFFVHHVQGDDMIDKAVVQAGA